MSSCAAIKHSPPSTQSTKSRDSGVSGFSIMICSPAAADRCHLLLLRHSISVTCDIQSHICGLTSKVWHVYCLEQLAWEQASQVADMEDGLHTHDLYDKAVKGAQCIV